MIPGVGAARQGPLIGAAIYVVAVAVLLWTQEDDLPEPLETSLTIRQWAFLARMAEPADSARGSPFLPEAAEDSLADLARRVPATDKDRLRGAAVAVALGQQHLVPLFVGPIAWSDPVARTLTVWSLDPTARVEKAELDLVRACPLEPHLKDHIVHALARSSGDDDLAREAAISISERRFRVLAAGGGLALVALTLLVVGGAMWFRVRRGLDTSAPPLGPLTRGSAGPMVRVLIYFLAVFLTVNILLPPVLESLVPGVGLGPLLVWTYVVVGSAGLWLVHAVGRGSSNAPWSELVGLRGAFSSARLPASLGWAVRAYCLLWPATVAATILWSGVAGEGRGAFENPIAVLLATEPDVILLLGTVAILAPLFEEPLFRGYLYGRLRRHMTPIPAAALSGLVFAAAHLSWSSLLPLAAIGFTLALAYERSRDLATPMLAHGAWNLVEALMIVAVFRG